MNTKPPKNLSPEAKGWWRRITTRWTLDDAAKMLLQSGLESFDRMRQAQAVLAKEGLVVVDRHGQQRPHPCCGIEMSAKSSLIRHFRALNLDVEPLRDGPGRPPGRVNWKKEAWDAKYPN